jgi:hypothetical protein
MTAIGRKAIKLWVVPANTAPSTLLASSVWSSSTPLGYIPGVIKDYAVSGGGADVTTDPVFGGFVDKETPREQFEIELSVIPSIEGTLFDFDEISLARDATTTTIFTSRAVGGDRAFFIQAENTATTTYKSWGFNNCSVTSGLDISHSADDNMEQTVTLKFAPTDESGKPNLQKARTVVTSLANWAALTT